MHQALQLLAIAGVLLLGVASPGPNFAIVTSTATGVSRRAGVLAGLGLAAASFTWATLAVAGIGVVLAQSPWVFTALRLVGAAYLIWLGARMVLGARKPKPEMDGTRKDGIAAVRSAFLVSMTNPKSIAFYGSILTVMVPAAAPSWFYVAIVAIAAVVSATWYCGLALLVSHGAVRRLLERGRGWIDATMGVILIGMGGKLLLSR